MKCAHCRHTIDIDDFVCPACGQVIQNENDVLFEEEHQKTIDKGNRQMKRNETGIYQQIRNYTSIVNTNLKRPGDFSKGNMPEGNLLVKNFGWITGILIIFFNTIAISCLAHFSFSHFQWFANISLLPDLNLAFNPWLFTLKSFLFILLLLVLYTAVGFLVMRFIYQNKVDLIPYLNHLMSYSSLCLPISVLTSILAMISPLLFFLPTIILFIVELFTFSLSFTYLCQNVREKPRFLNHYYIIVLSYAITIVIAVALITLIF